MRKISGVILAATLCVIFVSGCSSKKQDENKAPSEIETTSATADMMVSGSLLENVTLNLPENISRESVSNTRAYFSADGEVTGGIEILNVAGQRDSAQSESEYADLAIAVTKLVRDGEYDCSVDTSSSIADVVADIKFRDGQTFAHYFFFGENVVYDVWTDYDVLDGQDMISILKTLHSDDIVNPQDSAPANEGVPILNLRTDLPEGILQMPSTTKRLLFYNVPLDEYVTGENVVGGIEQIDTSQNLDALGLTAVNLAQELYGEEFAYTSGEDGSGEEIVAVIFTDSGDTHLVHYIRNVGAECYDVWTDTSIIPKEDALAIAQSCQY